MRRDGHRRRVGASFLTDPLGIVNATHLPTLGDEQLGENVGVANDNIDAGIAPRTDLLAPVRLQPLLTTGFHKIVRWAANENRSVYNQTAHAFDNMPTVHGPQHAQNSRHC